MGWPSSSFWGRGKGGQTETETQTVTQSGLGGALLKGPLKKAEPKPKPRLVAVWVGLLLPSGEEEKEVKPKTKPKPQPSVSLGLPFFFFSGFWFGFGLDLFFKGASKRAGGPNPDQSRFGLAFFFWKGRRPTKPLPDPHSLCANMRRLRWSRGRGLIRLFFLIARARGWWRSPASLTE